MTSIPNAIQTEFTRHFGLRYPIICAPMFLVSNTDMVVAAGEAGAIGTFPALNYRPIERYREAIREIKTRTQAPFGINIIVQKSNKLQVQQLDIALDEKVAWIITSLGNPKDFIRRAHEVGTKVYCDVVGLEHAKKVADLGADGLIAVGSGAGGHAGTISPFALVPYLRQEVKLPILCAGSIVDGTGMLAALSLGAAGAYMGTRFIASTECQVSHEYKDAIVQARCEDIVNTDRVDGFPGNFIRTDKLERLGLQPSLIEQLVSRVGRVRRAISLARAARALLGNSKKVSYKTIFSAGHGSGLIHEIEPVETIIQRTISEYEAAKAQLP